MNATSYGRVSFSLFSSTACSLLAVGFLVLLPLRTFSGGVVVNCTEADLRAALAGGGIVTFACDGTITLSNTLMVATNTVLDASGRSVALDGGFTNRILTIPAGITCALTNVRIINGWHSSEGGGIHNSGVVTMARCVVSNNVAMNRGGGIFNRGELNVFDSMFVTNRVPYAAIASQGGGINNQFGATLRINGCTFYGNGAYDAGAVYCASTGRMGATNCTMTDNPSAFGDSGILYGDFSSSSQLRVEVVNCTFSKSRVAASILGPIKVVNSIVPNCNNCVDGGNNILAGVDPRLGPLSDNGGPTFTMALLPDSPAINQGNNTTSPSADQRGAARPIATVADIGAFETSVSPSPVVIEFASPAWTVNEGSSNVTLNVLRRGNGGPAVSVNYTVSGGTAVAGFDFISTNGILSFAFGQTNGAIVIPIVNDTTPEGDETILATLSSPGGGASLGAAVTATVTIHDNDPVVPGTLLLGSAFYSVAEGTADMLLTVHRVNGSNGVVSVAFATSDGTALAGQDYAATNGLLVFGDTETIKSFAVRILSDAVPEGIESLQVSLSSPTGGASLGSPAVATLNIVDGQHTVSSCVEASLRAAVGAGGRVTLACDGTILLTGPLVVSNGVAIDATGHNVTLSGGGMTRLFTVRPGVTLDLNHLTLADGAALGTNGAGANSPGGSGEGGAIYSEGGIVQAANTGFLRNRANGGTGGSGSGGGRGGNARGGAVFAARGTVVLRQSTLSSNQVLGGAGGDAPIPFSGEGGSGFGGAMFLTNSQTILVECSLSTNRAAPGNPGKPVRFTSSGDSSGGAVHQHGGRFELSRSQFTDNSASGGFAINTPDAARAYGGGVSLLDGALCLTDCLFAENQAAAGSGGARGNVASGPSAKGGGVYLGSGTARLTNSTFLKNSAVGGAAYASSMALQGRGGIGLGAGVYSEADLLIANCTLAQNLAQGGGAYYDRLLLGQAGGAQGGGICSLAGQAILFHATLAGNAAEGSQQGTTIGPSLGGGVYSSNSSVTLQQTIVVNSLAGSNGSGSLIDGGHNLSSDASCNFTAPGSLNNTDPLLSPPADFGGPTPTMALLAGSPAIDAGGGSGWAATDQRGVARPFGAACDIGAFESAEPYTVIGQIAGYVPPASSASVGDGAASATVDAAGGYALHGLFPGPHTLKPVSPLAVFVPKTRLVNVNADTIGIDFAAYRTNAITIRSTPPHAFEAIFAGEAAVSYNVQTSPALPGTWGLHSTLTTDAEGLLRWSGTNLTGSGFFRVERP